MGLFGKNQPGTVSEEVVRRLWMVDGRLKALEDRFDAAVDDLKKRQAAVTTATSRLEQKKSELVDAPCADDDSDLHPAIAALKRRQGRVVAPNAVAPGSG